jgi:hypothetical protein
MRESETNEAMRFEMTYTENETEILADLFLIFNSFQIRNRQVRTHSDMIAAGGI